MQAWYKFQDWCKAKYGTKFADAYTAFNWMIDPEYCIVSQEEKKMDVCKIDPYLAKIQEMCKEKITAENFEENIELYKWASAIIFAIVDNYGKDIDIFKLLCEAATDYIVGDNAKDNKELLDLARQIKQLAWDGHLADDRKKDPLKEIHKIVNGVIDTLNKASPSFLRNNATSVYADAIFSIDKICKKAEEEKAKTET